MNQLPVADLRPIKSEFVAGRVLRRRIADAERADGDVADIERVPARQQWEEARVDELLTRAESEARVARPAQ